MSILGGDIIMRALLASFFLGLLTAGCSTVVASPGDTSGIFSGKTTVTWIGYDLFEYVPDVTDPLLFIASDGTKVSPKQMQTDGGSIPPILWALPGFSPWGYGPAYVIHDWLFEQHHCHYPGWETITFDKSATILGEAIQTLMNIGMVTKNPEARTLIEAAVRSEIAKNLWDKPEACMAHRLVAAAKHSGPKPVVAVFDLSHAFPHP